MTSDEIRETVTTVLIDEFKVDPGAVEREATFKRMGLDSLDLVSLAMSLEDRLSVEIPDEELTGIERLGQALDLLERKIGVAA